MAFGLNSLLVGLGKMPLHVQRKMVGASEGPLANLALEGLGAGVLPVVAGELVGAGEAPLALRPVALVRLLTGVDALVGLQVGALRVDLRAGGKVTVVDAPLLQLRVVAPVVLLWQVVVAATVVVATAAVCDAVLMLVVAHLVVAVNAVEVRGARLCHHVCVVLVTSNQLVVIALRVAAVVIGDLAGRTC